MECYIPKPLDTSDVTLYEKHLELVEKLAINEHETWASEMQNKGWSYGEVVNEIEKKTPYLVPFEQLPNENKEWNREVASEAIKNILKLGYTIVR